MTENLTARLAKAKLATKNDIGDFLKKKQIYEKTKKAIVDKDKKVTNRILIGVSPKKLKHLILTLN